MDQDTTTLRCYVCGDSGIEDVLDGEVKTAGYKKLDTWVDGSWVDASQVRVARICEGPHGTGCPWLKWQAELRALDREKKATKPVVEVAQRKDLE